MKIYVADSNIFLRFFLQDNPSQANRAEYYFRKAEKGEIEIRVVSEIIPEIEYVLLKVYKESRINISSWLSSLVKNQYFKVEQKEIWLETILIYSKFNVDLIDALLFVKKKLIGGKVLSFDKDFKKLERLDKKN